MLRSGGPQVLQLLVYVRPKLFKAAAVLKITALDFKASAGNPLGLSNAIRFCVEYPKKFLTNRNKSKENYIGRPRQT